MKKKLLSDHVVNHNPEDAGYPGMSQTVTVLSHRINKEDRDVLAFISSNAALYFSELDGLNQDCANSLRQKLIVVECLDGTVVVASKHAFINASVFIKDKKMFMIVKKRMNERHYEIASAIYKAVHDTFAFVMANETPVYRVAVA